MSKKNLYLAGPIAGLSKKEANGWRDLVKGTLGVYFNVINPLRHYEPENDHTPITQTDGNASNFVGRDLYDVRSANLLLVNYSGARGPSSGTTFELGYATALGIPYALVEPNHEFVTPFVLENATWKFDTLEEAIKYLSHLASPYVDG